MNVQSKMEPAGLALLRVPFPSHHISKRPIPTKRQTEEVKADFKKGVRCALCEGWHHPDVEHLDYVGHAALTNRLLDTDPEWSWEPLAVGDDGLPVFDRNGGLWIRLTILGTSRIGYGSADGKVGGDAVKEIIGDALRNAAMRFGAALDLWHKGELHPDDEPEEMPADEWAKLVQLIEATGKATAFRKKMMEKYKVQNLKLLNQDQYHEAVDTIQTFISEKVKAETNAKIAEDDLAY